jgi:NADH:ubiquinone reductase (non-electrogenic)
MKITLVEALPSVLPMFSKQLISYTVSTFKEAKIDILTKTMVKEVKENSVVLQMPDKSIVEMPCGMVVWAAVRSLSTNRRMLSKLSIKQGKHTQEIDERSNGPILLGAERSTRD